MTARAWWRMLRRYRFAVTADRLPMAALITLGSPLNALFALVQSLLYGRRIAGTALPPPVIIVGHWRAGTTLLHELLATDGDFVFPTTFECFAPSHFLLTWPVTRLSFLLPERRPMDEMALDWHRPQEDEFALINMGLRSPYEALAFPGRPEERHRFYDLALPAAAELPAWRAALTRFLKAVAFRAGRERGRSGRPAPRWLLLKNPVHTARIGLLARMFPEARFIHLVREPVSMYASTALTFRALTVSYACQNPDRLAADPEDTAEETLDRLDRLYEHFEADRAALAPGRFVEIRYEELSRDPAAALERIYSELRLKPFERGEALRAYLRNIKGYRTNRHEVDAATVRKIDARWGWYRAAFGYRAPAAGEG